MATAVSSRLGRSPARRVLVVGAIGGMTAGMMMAMVEMLYGWASDAHTFWDAPMAIWAWVAGVEHFGAPENHVGPIILGLGGHMMNSVMAGVMFAVTATVLVLVLERRKDLDPRVVDLAVVMYGVGYGLALWTIMRYAILPLNEVEDDLFTTSLVSPAWVWWLAHAVLGMTAGLIFVGVRRILRQPSQVESPRELSRVA